MLSGQESWEIKAAAKRASTYAKIPKEWLLDEATLDRASKQRNLTGAFIEQLLTADEAAIIGQGSVLIVAKVRAGEYSSVQVARAFCKTAAIAQQIVSGEGHPEPATSLTHALR